MRVTEELISAFNGADFSGMGNADWEDSHVRAGLEAVLATPEMQALERFARAAAAAVVSDGVEEWNGMVDVWNALPQGVVESLLEPR